MRYLFFLHSYLFYGTIRSLPVWNGQIIPGFLVWVALSVSIGGTLISLLLGWKLPGLEYRNQVVEAKMRRQLVFSEDDFSQEQLHDSISYVLFSS